MSGYKYENKEPIELTEEEIYELVKQIAFMEYSKNPNANLYQSAEDGAIEFLTYAYEKDAKGKKGMSYLRQLPMKYFRNTVHYEIRNGINYNLRKKPVKRMLYETDSLQEPVFETGNNEYNRTRGDYIIDEKYINDVETKTDLDYIIKKIDDIEDNNLYIKLGYDDIHKFSYKNLIKLFFSLSDNRKLNSKDFKGVIFDKETNTELDDIQIKKVLSNFKSYIKDKNILGGIA